MIAIPQAAGTIAHQNRDEKPSCRYFGWLRLCPTSEAGSSRPLHRQLLRPQLPGGICLAFRAAFAQSDRPDAVRNSPGRGGTDMAYARGKVS